MHAFIAANLVVAFANIIMFILGMAGGYRLLGDMPDGIFLTLLIGVDATIWSAVFFGA